MRVLGNILWFIFGGLELGLVFSVEGLSYMITIIGIPFGLQLFKMVPVIFVPFGKGIRYPRITGGKVFGNVLWAIFFGWWNALVCLLIGLVCFITIIGIPFGKQWLKLARLMFLPFGAEVYNAAAEKKQEKKERKREERLVKEAATAAAVAAASAVAAQNNSSVAMQNTYQPVMPNQSVIPNQQIGQPVQNYASDGVAEVGTENWFCTNCGVKNTDVNSRFCENCGAPKNQNQQPAATNSGFSLNTITGNPMIMMIIKLALGAISLWAAFGPLLAYITVGNKLMKMSVSFMGMNSMAGALGGSVAPQFVPILILMILSIILALAGIGLTILPKVAPQVKLPLPSFASYAATAGALLFSIISQFITIGFVVSLGSSASFSGFGVFMMIFSFLALAAVGYLGYVEWKKK